MNVPAKEVAKEMQIKTQQLMESVANADQQAVRECVAVIEAYCRLLKGEQSQPTSATKQEIQPYREQPQPTSAVVMPSVPTDGPEKGKASLFDF